MMRTLELKARTLMLYELKGSRCPSTALCCVLPYTHKTHAVRSRVYIPIDSFQDLRRNHDDVESQRGNNHRARVSCDRALKCALITLYNMSSIKTEKHLYIPYNVYPLKRVSHAACSRGGQTNQRRGRSSRAARRRDYLAGAIATLQRSN